MPLPCRSSRPSFSLVAVVRSIGKYMRAVTGNRVAVQLQWWTASLREKRKKNGYGEKTTQFLTLEARPGLLV